VVLDWWAQGRRKILVSCGINHSFRKFRWGLPGELWQEPRLGHYLNESVGQRLCTLHLHAPWPPVGGYGAGPFVPAAEGAVDRLLQHLSPDGRHFGVWTSGSWGRLRGRDSLYAVGHPQLCLADLCDGFLCAGLVKDYRSVRLLDGFVQESQLGRARVRLDRPDLSLEQWRALIEDRADLSRWFGRQGSR
jgi:hypothetical protein